MAAGAASDTAVRIPMVYCNHCLRSADRQDARRRRGFQRGIAAACVFNTHKLGC